MISNEDVLNFLHQKYEGVTSDEKIIAERYQSYVKFNFANFLFEHSFPYLKKEHKILDIGSGFGSYVYLLKKNGFDAHGIEISEFLANFSRQRLQLELGFSSAEANQVYEEGSALDMPYQNNLFDVVTIWNVLEHVTNYKQVLQEILRVLRPGGKLFLMNVNYSFCFLEPHYRVPWLPFMPRKIAIKYLHLLGKNSKYFDTGIFYVSNFKIINFLRKNGASISSVQLEKISNHMLIGSKSKKMILDFLKFFKIDFLLRLFLKAKIYNPFTSYIDILVTKK